MFHTGAEKHVTVKLKWSRIELGCIIETDSGIRLLNSP